MAKQGIKETKDLLVFVLDLIVKGKEAKDQGLKKALSDIKNLLDLAPKALAAFKGIDQIDDEFRDLDEAEAQELIGVVQSYFPDFVSEKAFKAAGDTVKAIKAGVGLYQTFYGEDDVE